jgi:pimeloyl-ACP methyl ester carboxylesterase
VGVLLGKQIIRISIGETNMECALENITVHYEVFGEGKPIIILPGWSLNTRLTAHETEPYFQQRKRWKRIYIDPPGHGKTPGKDWITNQDQILEVLLACIDKLIPGQRFSLIGTSLGAYLARGVLRFRADVIDGIAMIIPIILAEDEKRTVPTHKVLVEDPSVIASATPAEAFLFDMAVVRTRKWLEFQRSFPEIPDQESGDFEFLSKIREQPQNYSFSFDVDHLSEPFPGPSLIITGRQDSIAGYRDAWNILENYPRATYVVLDRSGHMLEEKEGLVNILMNEWLDRIEESAGVGL